VGVMADDSEFMIGLLKTIQSNMAEMGRRMDRLDARMTSMEDRLERIEKRQTAAQHFHQQVLVHLTSIDERIDNFTAELVGLARRVGALEAANAR
jgi:septal ring factor EnvC (AmiA/AmiB activator)